MQYKLTAAIARQQWAWPIPLAEHPKVHRLVVDYSKLSPSCLRLPEGSKLLQPLTGCCIDLLQIAALTSGKLPVPGSRSQVSEAKPHPYYAQPSILTFNKRTHLRITQLVLHLTLALTDCSLDQSQNFPAKAGQDSKSSASGVRLPTQTVLIVMPGIYSAKSFELNRKRANVTMGWERYVIGKCKESHRMQKHSPLRISLDATSRTAGSSRMRK